MKNMIYLFLIGSILTVTSSLTWAQSSCLPEGITFTTQDEVDNFPINYPGCTVIEGNLSLQGIDIIGLDSLYSLTSIEGMFYIMSTSIEDLDGIQNLYPQSSIVIQDNKMLKSLTGLEHLTNVQLLSIMLNDSILDLTGLDNLEFAYQLVIKNNSSLVSLKGLENLKTVQSILAIEGLDISNFDHLSSLDSIGTSFHIWNCNNLTDLSGLNNVSKISTLTLLWNDNLRNLTGIDKLKNISTLHLFKNEKLHDLTGLNSMESINNLRITDCDSLINIDEIENVKIESSIIIKNNPELKFCSIKSICDFIFNHPDNVTIENNKDDCFDIESTALHCEGQIISVNSIIINNQICDTAGYMDKNIFSARLTQGALTSIKSPNSLSKMYFYLNSNDSIMITLNELPGIFWEICNDTIIIDPTEYDNVIYSEFVLQPRMECSYLSIDLNLPPTFRGCLVSSDMRVRTQNTGTIPAENVELAVVIPFDLMEVESAVPPPVAQSGDTLFFALGDLDIFQVADVHLTVRTRCDTFLLGHTICIEAFAEMDNPCPPDLPLGSRVQVRASCQNDEKVVFTLTNTGDAPTDVPHHYFIIEDEVVLLSDEFHLNVLESIQVEVDASGATMRMEATKLPNGMLTAAALEGCGGFTPGMINAFWLDRGESHYDIACRPVILAYDPNDKLAIPSGVGPAHLLAPNRTIEYTIRFQNTGTDTAFRVLLTDILPPELDVNTFRPGYASHDYTWEIRGLDSLDVLFFPIALPDSAASQEGSQGFFTFSMDQKPNLPDGTLIRNTASIIFDFNPPIVTNTVFHTIGTLSVHLDPPQHQGMVWLLHGNPTRDQAIFRAPVSMPGVKRFELYDLMGRGLRQEHFDGDEFLFQRGGLRSGMYLFRITDDRGRQFTGKIVIAE